MKSLRSWLCKARSVAMVSSGNLRARWPRALVALIAVALGVALVTAVTTGYTSARQTILDWNYSWVGHSHVHIQPIPDELWSDPRMPIELAQQIARLGGVKQVVTRQKECLLASTDHIAEAQVVYGYGIDLAGEERVRGAGVRLQAGRMIGRTSRGEALVERHLADALGLDLGGTLVLRRRPGKLPAEVNLDELSLEDLGLPPVLSKPLNWFEARLRELRERQAAHAPARSFTIVGIIDRPRFSTVKSIKAIQLRDLVMVSQQDLADLFDPVPVGLESMDVILAQPTPENTRHAATSIRRLINQHRKDHPNLPPDIEVETADEKIAQLDRNLRLFRMISRTVSVVALLTASYIIFTTLGMGMVQRQAELGMLRCVGAGRLQIALATFAEAVPIAAGGIVLGVLAGLAAARGVIGYYHVFFTRMVVSVPGLVWAATGGLAAVLLAVALPAYMASRVSPLAASRPQTRRIPIRTDLVLGAVGLGLIVLSFLTRVRLFSSQTPDQLAGAYLAIGVPMVFAGYFLAVPVVVATAGRLLKFVAAGLLWVRPRLLDDQMQTARWRTAATVCALMVGISVLVNLRVHSESVIRGWKLPTKIPPGFLFFFEPLDRGQLQQVIDRPEVRDPVPLMAFWVRYQGEKAEGDDSVCGKFLAGSIEHLEGLIQVNFVQVQHDRPTSWAIEQVRDGRGVLATREFATRQRLEAGQQARLWRHKPERSISLPVVGIIESPTMDMAIDFLNIRDRFQNLSSGTVIGSVDAANRLLGEEHPEAVAPRDPAARAEPLPLRTRLLLFNFAPAGSRGGGDQKAQLERIGRTLDDMGAQYYAGSLAELREMIVGEFRAVVSILQKIALWAMAIASLGVGFSMAANVQSRRRQLAVLRAVGLTRFQLSRQILAEAVTIALLGSALGILHGVHLAVNSTHFDRALFGMRPDLTLPAGALGLAIGFAVACCLVASLLPALRAGRTNILAALRQV